MNPYWNVYLSMDESGGPYEFVFNVALVGGALSLAMNFPDGKKGFSYLQPPMEDNNWSLTQPTSGGDFVLTYSGPTPIDYIPSLTVRRLPVGTHLPYSYFKVTSCVGFGIQMMNMFDYTNFQPYTQPPFPCPGSSDSPASCDCSPGSSSNAAPSGIIQTTASGAAIVIGVPLLIIFILCLSFGLALQKANKKNTSLAPKAIMPK
jgi:hypothetical protein